MKFTFSKKWMIFGSVALIACLLSLATLKFAPAYRGMVKLFFYTIITHVYISLLPYEPVLLFYGKFYNLFLIAFSGGIAACMAGFIDYETLTPVLKHKTIKNLYHDKKLYRKSVNFFLKAPFWMIVIAALTPIPFYPFKFLSIASGYPEDKYLWALFVGRVPRYYFLAFCGRALNVPNWVLLVAFALMFACALVRRLPEFIKNIRAKIKRRFRKLKLTDEDTV